MIESSLDKGCICNCHLNLRGAENCFKNGACELCKSKIGAAADISVSATPRKTNANEIPELKPLFVGIGFIILIFGGFLGGYHLANSGDLSFYYESDEGFTKFSDSRSYCEFYHSNKEGLYAVDSASYRVGDGMVSIRPHGVGEMVRIPIANVSVETSFLSKITDITTYVRFPDGVMTWEEVNSATIIAPSYRAANKWREFLSNARVDQPTVHSFSEFHFLGNIGGRPSFLVHAESDMFCGCRYYSPSSDMHVVKVSKNSITLSVDSSLPRTQLVVALRKNNPICGENATINVSLVVPNREILEGWMNRINPQ